METGTRSAFRNRIRPNARLAASHVSCLLVNSTSPTEANTQSRLPHLFSSSFPDRACSQRAARLPERNERRARPEGLMASKKRVPYVRCVSVRVMSAVRPRSRSHPSNGTQRASRSTWLGAMKRSLSARRSHRSFRPGSQPSRSISASSTSHKSLPSTAPKSRTTANPQRGHTWILCFIRFP